MTIGTGSALVKRSPASASFIAAQGAEAVRTLAAFSR
jgi:hypothetical protein